MRSLTRRPRAGTLSAGLCALPVLMLVVLAWRRRWLSDDGFINLRIVENLRDGYGPVFNPGERVEAFTSPLWVGLLWVGELLTPSLDLEPVAILLGVASAALGLAAGTYGAWRVWDRAGRGPILPFGAVAVAAVAPVWDYSTAGLDTALAFAWLGLAFLCMTLSLDRRRWVAGIAVLLGLGPLVRPDLALFALAFLGLLILRSPGRGLRRAALPLACAAAIPVAYQLFRMGYFATLVPNTALAKSAGQSSWDRGWAYTWDFVADFWLFVPLLAFAGAVAVLVRDLIARGDREAIALVVVTEACALLHVVYVIRLGGDWMHARMLLPDLFALALPVMVVRVRAALVPALAAVAVWSGFGLVSLRASELQGPYYVEDVRIRFVDFVSDSNPVRLRDFARAPQYEGGVRLRDRARAHREVVIATVVLPNRSNPTVPARRSTRWPVVAHFHAIGIAGYAAGPRVYIADAFGLADPIGSRLPAIDRRRAGHEKLMGADWVLGRFAVPGATTPGTNPARVVAARRAIRCGPLARVDRAVTSRLTWGRFWSNVGEAWRLRWLRIPQDPREAAARWCSRPKSR
ncbi:MAG TPA: hypothetical protein VNB64_12400 [Solirubrobacteraceae bacterium]|nr:hypothetical protein [Solirubrobacteraceae bacterium]